MYNIYNTNENNFQLQTKQLKLYQTKNLISLTLTSFKVCVFLSSALNGRKPGKSWTCSTSQGPNHGCLGHSRRCSSGPLHRLAIGFGLRSLHQRQIQEGRIMAVRAVLDYFWTNTEIINQNYCSRYFALWSNCMPGRRSPSSSSCSSVDIIELFTINILWSALRFGISYVLNQWQREGKECENKGWTFVFISCLVWGQVFILIISLLCAVNQTWFTSG